MLLVDMKCDSCGHVHQDVLINRFDDVLPCEVCAGPSKKMFAALKWNGDPSQSTWAVATSMRGDVIWEKKIEKPYVAPKSNPVE